MLANTVKPYKGTDTEKTLLHVRLNTAQEGECVLLVSVGMHRQEVDIHSVSLKLHPAKVHCDKQDVTSQQRKYLPVCFKKCGTTFVCVGVCVWVCAFHRQRFSLGEIGLKVTHFTSVCVRSEVDVYSEI